MEFETGVSLYEKIEIETAGNILPSEVGKLILDMEGLYNIYLFFFLTQPSGEKNLNLIWSKEFLEARDAAYPPYEEQGDVEDFQNRADKILYAFNEARELGHYNDILASVPHKLKLQVKRLSTNSPVKIDLLGLGEVIKEFKEFILAFLNLKIDSKMKREEVRKLELENYEKILELSIKYKISPEMVSKSSSDFANTSNDLAEFLEKNKIKNISVKEETD